jgi:hypothetical protein
LRTTRRDGSPQASPVTAGVDAGGRVVISTYPERAKWHEYRSAMVAQGKSLIRVAIQTWGPIATGGFPARLAQD